GPRAPPRWPEADPWLVGVRPDRKRPPRGSGCAAGRPGAGRPPEARSRPHVRRDRGGGRPHRGGGQDEIHARARAAPRRFERKGYRAVNVRDREVLDLLRDEPELLAIADAVAETERSPRHFRSYRAPAAVALAAVAIFGLV